MSRAFVSEAAAEASAAVLPERPVSTAPNLVTPRGLTLIDAELGRLQRLLEGSASDDPTRAAVARDLRYWRIRRASAQMMAPAAAKPGKVAFGARVSIRRGDAASSYTIVGEDEADPPKGLLSWMSPLARSLMGARSGDVVEGGGRPPVTVEAVERG